MSREMTLSREATVVRARDEGEVDDHLDAASG
jgi:hypothetical protein